MDKREFLKGSAAVGASILATRHLYGEPPTIPQTYIYKTTGACELKADVYGSDASIKKPGTPPPRLVTSRWPRLPLSRGRVRSTQPGISCRSIDSRSSGQFDQDECETL